MVTKPLNYPGDSGEDDSIVDDEFFDAMQVQETEPAPPPIDITPGHSGSAWRILFHIAGSQASSIGLDIWRVTVLGRTDPMSAFRPDVDFAPYGAMRHGVSRRHALIRPGEQHLYINDQNSTNGTWVNGQRLLTGREFPLTDGDIVELGALRMSFRIVDRPGDDEPSQPIPVPKRKTKRRRFGWPRG